jgi:DNA-binding transcriptional LysR family regulator
MSYIESRLFHYFVAVAEERHFAQAALRLGISPPTLTHQIQKLERELGVRLLIRKGRTKVVLTGAGQRFLDDAREALRHVEQATVRARQAGRGELGDLELGFMTWVAGADLLRTWIGPFEQAHPAIDITVRRLSPVAQIGAIVRNELDAGFSRAPNKYPPGVRGFEIYREPLMLALPGEHPLARRKTIKPAMLAREAFVKTTPELDLGFSGLTEAVARIGNFIPRVVKRQDDFMAVLAYVALGRGIAVVPAFMKAMNLANVVFCNIAADAVPQTSISFVYGSAPSPSAKLLIGHMQRHALRNGGKGAAPPHNHDRIIIPSALNLAPHPEARAEGAPRKMQAAALGPYTSRLGATRRAPQGEEMRQR